MEAQEFWRAQTLRHKLGSRFGRRLHSVRAVNNEDPLTVVATVITGKEKRPVDRVFTLKEDEMVEVTDG